MTTSAKSVIIYDTEVFENCYLFTAKELKSGKIVQLWADQAGHMDHLGKLLNNPSLLWVSFNGINFDAPIMAAAVQGRDEGELKRMANAIIENGMSAWMSYRDFGVERLDFDHIDLIEVAPGVMVSLKQYEARLKMKRMIDLPFPHDHILSDEDKVLLGEYCINDIEATENLWNALKEAIELRENMSEMYKIDLRSKSDAQMAEAIIVKELKVDRNYKPPKPASVRYKAPPFVQPDGGVLQHIKDRIESHVFKINRANGAVEFPDFLKEPILIGSGVYQMGIGGLHSKHDVSVCYTPDDSKCLLDADVGSYYPHLILNAGIYPKGLGHDFIDLYQSFVTSRMENKALAGRLKKEISKLGSVIKDIENGVSQTG